jgi:HAE1 family hydrophobic/amphiphilic exporter-1
VNPIRTFIHRPVFTGMLTLAVLVFGIVAYPKIGVDQFPEIEFPFVTVTTVLPGADPEAIERTVTKPLEETFNTLPGLDTLRSVNLENVSQIIIRFDLERNADIAAQDVRDKVQATLSKLPKEIQTPIVQKLDIGAAPIATLAFSANLPIERLTKVADDVVKPALQQIQGVGAVELWADASARSPSSPTRGSSRATGCRPPTWSRRCAHSRSTSRAAAPSSRARSAR